MKSLWIKNHNLMIVFPILKNFFIMPPRTCFSGNFLWGKLMSDKTTDKAAALPQFMKENTNSFEIEEKESWLNQNLHKLMIAISIIWFAVVLIYVTQFFGWSNLFLMMPDEFGGFLAGVTLPLAIIWVVMAYIDRGSAFNKEAKFLRAYMNQLVYPEDGAPQTAKAMADAIRSQVVELQQVSKLAHEQTSQIKDAIKENVDDFAKLVAKLDNYSSKTIVELSDGVKFLTANFENILSRAQTSTQNLAQINREFINGGNDIEEVLGRMFAKIVPCLNEIKETSESLRSVTDNSSEDIVKANENLQAYIEKTNVSMAAMRNLLEAQIGALKQVADKTKSNSDEMKSVLAGELSEFDEIIQKHGQKLNQVLIEAEKSAKEKTDDLAKAALANIGIINNSIKNGMDGIGDAVGVQIGRMDEALVKNNRDIAAFIKSLEDKAENINKKFAAHGELVAQELDKLMVRSANLEEAIAMRVANLGGISEKAITSIKQVDDALSANVANLDEKVLAANNDILSYTATLQEKTSDFERISGDSADKVLDLTEVLNKRYEYLQKVTADGLKQLQSADKEINSATENLIVQTAQSVENINKVSEIMQKNTNNLNEASSVVVMQSQVSEASLSQQQKLITDTAARVEGIKNELKRQINELSSASGELEKDAAKLLDNVKANIAKMLSQCNDAINKSRAINDNLSEQANMFDTSANRTMAKVTQFETTLLKQSQNMETLAKTIAEKSEEIGKTLDIHTVKLSDTSNETVSMLSASIADFETKSDNIYSVSQNAAELIQKTITGLDDKMATLTMLLKQQEGDFYEYCAKVQENADKMADVLRKQISGVEDGADKLFAKLVILEDDTGRRADAIAESSQKSFDKLTEIEKSLADKHDLIEKTVDFALDKMKNANELIENGLEKFGNSVEGIKETTTDTIKGLRENSTQLKDIHETVLKEGEVLQHNLESQIKYAENAGVKLSSQNKNIADMLEMQKNSITEVVNTLATQARLGEASLAQQYKYLTDATVEATAKLQEINAVFNGNTGEIFETTNKLSYEFEVLSDRLLKACDAINKASKDSIKNVDQISLRLNQCSEELDTTIYHSVENIGSVFNEYEKYVAGFNTITSETSTGVVEVNNLISAQSDKMLKISNDAKKLIDCFNNVLSDIANQLSNKANEAYDKVNGLGQDLKKLGMEMDDAAKLSATHLEKSSDKMRATINEVASNAERISNTILSSGEVFIKQSDALTAIADETAAKVNNSIENMVNAGKVFEKQGEEIVKSSIRFNDTVNTQTQILSECSGKAEKALRALTNKYKDIDVDTFLKDAGKIIFSLENVSVDINRLLNPKDEEDLWKKFYSGDTQIFVRTIAKNMTNAQVAALRKELEKNAELRRLVGLYLSEFEGLVEKSKNHEYSAALMAVISGADLGRLYYVLAKALNKLN